VPGLKPFYKCRKLTWNCKKAAVVTSPPRKIFFAILGRMFF